MSLRDEVEKVLPGWESWYPSLFDAAVDLGVIRARVCAPSSLLLSSRHSGVQSAAADAHREKWGGVLPDVRTANLNGNSRRKRRKRKGKRS